MNTKEPFVITISRELGSGGRTIGRKLAAQLGVRYSDKTLIDELMKKFNLTTYEIESIKAKKRNWFSDFIEFVAPVPNSGAFIGFDANKGMEWAADPSMPADIFKAESEILKGIAEKGSCVIAGRSGFHVLKDHPNHLHVFITASLENRIARVMNKQCLNREQAVKLIEGIDKARENYIQRYTGTSRYDARHYDLVISADGHSEEEIADLILSYIGY